MKKHAIIVAGGSGSRMQSEIPKQFLLLNEKPVLLHTIEVFLKILDINIVVVLPKNDIEYWHSITEKYPINLNQTQNLQITIGGATRFQSVRNGINEIIGEGVVAIHDGVRPLISLEIIQKGFEYAIKLGSAVTSVESKDSVRIINDDFTNKAIERKKIRLVQTPQTFNLVNFRKACEVEEQPFFTDCASVMDYSGYEINLIDGSYENIKITTPEDLIIAQNILAKRTASIH